MAKELDSSKFWLIKNNPITKAGIFPYLGRQISPDLEPERIYHVLRPEAELFAEETVKSFNLIPLLIGHPRTLLGRREEGFVPAEEKGMDGTTGEAAKREGDKIVNDIKLFSERIKDEVNSGKKELSAGYFCDFVPEAGLWRGQHYDFVQKNIRGNHIALVEKGRSGSDVRVMDSAEALPKNNRQFVCDAMDITVPWTQDENPNHNPENGQFAPKGHGGSQSAEPAAKSEANGTPGVVKITGQELGDYKDIKELRQKAVDYYKTHLQGKSVEHPELGKVLFSRKGINKVISSSGNENKLKFVPALLNMIESGKYAGEEALKHPREDGIVKFHRLNHVVQFKEKKYNTSVLVGEDKQGNRFYNFNEDVDGWKEKNLSTAGPRQSRGDGKATNSIADNEENFNMKKLSEMSISEMLESASDGMNLFIEEDLSSKTNGVGGKDAAPEKENEMDKREIIREIMAISAKPVTEFEGGEEEKVEAIAKLAEKLAYNPSEAGANDAGPKDEDPAKKPEEKPKDKAADEEAPKDDKNKKPEGNAQDAALSMDAMEKALLERMGRKTELVSRLTPIIGAFDSAAMTEKEVAAYACEKLGKKVAMDNASEYLKGYLDAYRPSQTRITFRAAQDSAPAGEDKVLAEFKEGK